MAQFQVDKVNIADNRLVDSDTKPGIQKGEVLLKVDSFSFTANNITYAIMGEQLRYWQFFPALENVEDKWGVIPVWGFADVVESNCDDIPVGDRLFGYFPPETHMVMKPVHVGAGRMIDGSDHRASLPPGYNMYRRVKAEPHYNPAMDNARMLLFPLHITSFCLWDYLQDNAWFDAQQVIVLSASSKTSIGLAYAIEADENAPPCIAVTSSKNQGLVDSLQSYDKTVVYENLSDIDGSKPSVIVDMSGNGDVMQALHAHLGENMQYCINVGVTHWDEDHSQPTESEGKSEMFFAPGHIQKRLKDWGPEVFEQKSLGFMTQAAKRSLSWLKINNIDGLNGLKEVYPDVCAGNISPDQGLIVKL